MPRILPCSAVLAIAIAALGVAPPAFAQATPAPTQAGFALDRFNPSERGSEWFALDSLDLRGNVRPAVGVVGEWGYKPLVIYDAQNNERAAVVEHQFFLHVGASLVLLDRLRIAFNLPIALYQTGQNGSANGVQLSSPEQAALGDGRASLDIRLLGRYGDPFQLAVGGQFFTPTGQRDRYTGDDRARGIVHLMMAGEAGIFAYAAKGGFMIRGLDNADLAGSPIGNELIFGASAGVRVADRKLLIGPEIYGSTVVSNSDAFFAKRSTPLEAILGGHYTIGTDWRIGAGAGPGLTRGYGSPKLRVLASIEWTPAYVPPVVVSDRDGDGVVDGEDACPDVPGVRTSDPATNGCPLTPKPKDRDGDGILDDDDACPDAPGVRTDDPKTNGCPDRDGDGIVDKEDACPEVKGVKTNDPKTNGCPADRDGDGIADADDACPDVKGVKTNDPKTNGCPPDRDGDGVYDPDDACPDGPGVKTNDPKTNGCPNDPDRDKDGILNEVDACPDTPGEKTNDPKTNGCPKASLQGNVIKINEQVKFATGSAVILPASNALLTAVVKVLNDHPEIKKLRVEGHTDNVGGAAYNKNLSNQRAASVAKWLTTHGVDQSRLESQGFGLEKPIEDNKTEAGRRENRRVEFHVDTPNPAP